jgi:hypothetical protein
MIPENSGACGLPNRCDLRLGHLKRMPARPIFFRSTKHRRTRTHCRQAGPSVSPAMKSWAACRLNSMLWVRCLATSR